MGLREYHREGQSTHGPCMSVGTYFWAESQKKYTQDRLRSNEVRTALRVSATPEVPLPSMRDIDVKNQPTTTVEQNISFREAARGQDSGDLRDENEMTNVVL